MHIFLNHTGQVLLSDFAQLFVLAEQLYFCTFDCYEGPPPLLKKALKTPKNEIPRFFVVTRVCRFWATN